MTLTTEVNRADNTGNGVTDEFYYSFLIFDEDHLQVYLDGEVQLTGYSVSGVGEAVGGSVIFDTPPANGVKVTLLRVVPQTQETDYLPYDPFPANTHERALDWLTMLVQQVREITDRCVRARVGADIDESYLLPAYDAGKALMWDESSKILKNSTDNFDGIVTAAEAARDLALEYRNTAQDYMNDSQGYAIDSQLANNQAQVAKSEASESEELARQWATQDEDTLINDTVHPVGYSAFHWAQKSEEYSDRTNLSDVWIKNQRFSGNAVVAGSSYTINMENEPSLLLHLTEDLTLAVSSMEWGFGVELMVDQPAGGGCDLMFSAAFNLSKYDIAPNPAANARTLYWLWSNGSEVFIRKIWEDD